MSKNNKGTLTMTTNINGSLYIKLALIMPQKAWILFLHGEENYETMETDTYACSIEVDEGVLNLIDINFAKEAVANGGDMCNIPLAELENAY